MNTHAIVAAALTAVSLSAFAQPGATSSGAAFAPPHDDVARATHRSPGALPAAGFVFAKIDQNNTPPDRGSDPDGRTRSGSRL
ncbi:hypothetical protein NUV26_32730 [Burkholderia pseudomultivorans]|uniref:Uncharacterized protein n=2 Tax=Burkholderia cepacia complex TaxID=87882 RepID=A0AAN0RW11_9BURK|nr:hypothetical protein [Burkholderia pseudomultivorans]AIO34659.1 hypothetical protein DM39_3404 [Burkholderia cenocepacia]EGD00850.1 hypothetical protein B1M_29515 [Burkholderia sp. TJI49]AOI88411.1 hypothetical protein WS57_06150 [Burkholderia pseudomultivorans]KVC37183.1 hypothetical protein WS58_25135 [Burkholderia pseudomultivorans]KWF57391.1 hypothetical protein WT57_31220 [Burkholderia pseudomultivorans]